MGYAAPSEPIWQNATSKRASIMDAVGHSSMTVTDD